MGCLCIASTESSASPFRWSSGAGTTSAATLTTARRGSRAIEAGRAARTRPRRTTMTTSSIVILSAPATRRPLSSNPEKSDDHQRRVGRNHVPSDVDLHHATGRDQNVRNAANEQFRGYRAQLCTACAPPPRLPPLSVSPFQTRGVPKEERGHMKIHSKRRLGAVLAFAALVPFGVAACGTDSSGGGGGAKVRKLTLLVGTEPGGGFDLTARSFAQAARD